MEEQVNVISCKYRVKILGSNNLLLTCFPHFWQLDTEATQCQGRMAEHARYKSTEGYSHGKKDCARGLVDAQCC